MPSFYSRRQNGDKRVPAFTRRDAVEAVLSTAMFAGAAFFLPFPLIAFPPALLALSFSVAPVFWVNAAILATSGYLLRKT